MKKRSYAGAPARQRGQGLVEYSIVTLLAVLVLVAQPNVLIELVQAMRKLYAAFTYALSLSWI